jgi:hypothetical protein
MQSTVDSFEFNGYRITPDKQTVFFDYRLIASGKQTEEFVEAVKLPAPLPSSVPGALVSKILESLHLVLGVSSRFQATRLSFGTRFTLKGWVNFFSVTGLIFAVW